MQIIPALIIEDGDPTNDFEELKARFAKIEPFLADFDNWVQLDITDGKFVETKTNIALDGVSYFTERANIDLHLMIESPENNIDDWISTKPKRITFHIEATDNPQTIVDACRKAKIEVGLALNPETPVSDVMGQLSDVDLILFLGVHPGRGGQKFIPEVLSKIETLCAGPTRAKIGLDGGVNLEVARGAKEAGADILVVGSYIFDDPNLREAHKRLTSI